MASHHQQRHATHTHKTEQLQPAGAAAAAGSQLRVTIPLQIGERERRDGIFKQCVGIDNEGGGSTPFQMWLQNGGYFSTDGREGEGGSEPCQIRFGGIRLRGG